MDNNTIQPFLRSVAEFVYSEFENSMHTISIVFPNKRAKLYFNKYLSEIINEPVFSPAGYTITEYMQSLSGKVYADQFTLLFNLFEVYKSVTGSNESFDSFLFYCEMLLADFDDIDKYMVNASMLYRNLTDLKEIDAYFEYLDEGQIKAIRQFWQTFISSRNSDEKRSFESLWNVMFRIYEEFNRKLDLLELSYEGKAMREAINKVLNGQTEIPGQKVLLVGFNALNTCEHKLFKYLKNSNKGLFFWDFDEYYINARSDYHEAAFFLKQLTREFPLPLKFKLKSELINPEKKIKIIDIPSRIGQAKALPELLNNLPEKWNENPAETVLALADETLLMPVLTSLPDSVESVNISMGFPLKDTLVYNLTEIILDLYKNRKCTNGKTVFYYKDVFRLLQNSLVQRFLENDGENIATAIKKYNLVYIGSEWLIEQSNLIGQLINKDVTERNYLQKLLEILELIANTLETLAANIKNIEREALARILAQLRRMNDSLSESKIEISFISLSHLINKILQGISVPFSGEPLTGLQIMGILETRTLDFSNLIILSMNEGVFPKSGNVPSFIPYSLRKAFEMPTIEHQDAIFAYYFYRLLHRAKNVQLVYSSSVSDTQKGEPSRYIQQLIYDKAFQTEKLTLGYRVYPQNKKEIIVNRNKQTIEILKNKYTGNSAQLLSPSAINIYLNCQLRFYFRYIAGIPEPEELLEEVESNTLGSILHKSMKILYENNINKISTKIDFESIKKDTIKTEQAINQAFWEEYLSPGIPFTGFEKIEFSGKNALVKHVIQHYVNKIINYDMLTAPLVLKNLEEKFEVIIKVNEELSIKTGGYIDRIDELNGQLRIIDYKTGKSDYRLPPLEILFDKTPGNRNNAAFQILLYCLVYKQKTGISDINAALFFVRDMFDEQYDFRLQTTGKPKIAIDNLKDVLPQFELFLKETLSEMFTSEGTFTQTSDEKKCVNCPYKSICSR